MTTEHQGMTGNAAYQMGFSHATDGKQELPFEVLYEQIGGENADAYACGFLDGLIVHREVLRQRLAKIDKHIGNPDVAQFNDNADYQDAMKRAAAHDTAFGTA